MISKFLQKRLVKPITCEVYQAMQDERGMFEGFAHHSITRELSYTLKTTFTNEHSITKKRKKAIEVVSSSERTNLRNDTLAKHAEVVQHFKRKGLKPMGQLIII